MSIVPNLTQVCESLDNMTAQQRGKITGICILVLIGALAIDVYKQAYDREKDSVRMVADVIIENETNDYGKAFALMNWVYEKAPGVCYQKSSLFESMARTEGLDVRHIVFRNIDGFTSHASSQVFVNGSWVFFDTFHGRVMTKQEYVNLGWSAAFVHFDCSDGACSNIDFPTLVVYTYILVKPLWVGELSNDTI